MIHRQVCVYADVLKWSRKYLFQEFNIKNSVTLVKIACC